jgi:histidinol phosphatase-like PHP family hydrolase
MNADISQADADYFERNDDFLGPFRKVDLHCHTTMSDGKKTVAELVADAVEKRLEFVAVTDHDIVNREAKILLERFGVASCESVEISARDYGRKHSLHLTFYAREINARTDAVLRGIREARTGKIAAQCELLASHGFAICLADLVIFAHRYRMSTDSISNGHIAAFVMLDPANRRLASAIAGREIANRADFIQSFLKEFSPFRNVGFAKVPDYEPTVVLVSELARDNRAVVSVAHPNFTFEKFGEIAEFESRMGEYAELGISAVEINPFADAAWLASVRTTADRVGMMLTFGSDSHGEIDERHRGLGGLHEIAITDPRLVQDSMDRLLSAISGRNASDRRNALKYGLPA